MKVSELIKELQERLELYGDWPVVFRDDLGEYDGGKLLSLKGDLAICHIINDLLTVRMEIDTYILDQYGIKLP